MLIKKICGDYFSSLESEEERDSPEYTKQNDRCHEIYEGLSETLDEKQKKKLLKLHLEEFTLRGQWRDEGFAEGSEKGFKLAVRLLLDSLRD
jgi:hypothetical protein